MVLAYDLLKMDITTCLQVVMEAVNKPRNITYKGSTDLVTETDKMSEAAILEVVKKNFDDHLILGEEGGVIGDTASDYLWCIDPLDGTTNFAHGYPSFAVSVGVLYRGNPAAAAVVEFVGGPMCWNTRLFSATAGGGAFCNGQRIQVSATNQVEQSLLVTGFGYDHDDAWSTNIDLFKEFTDVSRGVRRLGAAAVDMCHVALGIVEAYWEYRLKPWDMAAGVLMVEEAGGTVSRMDGGKFCVFDRSVLVSNGLLHTEDIVTGERRKKMDNPNTVRGGMGAINHKNKLITRYMINGTRVKDSGAKRSRKGNHLRHNIGQWCNKVCDNDCTGMISIGFAQADAVIMLRYHDRGITRRDRIQWTKLSSMWAQLETSKSDHKLIDYPLKNPYNAINVKKVSENMSEKFIEENSMNLAHVFNHGTFKALRDSDTQKILANTIEGLSIIGV
ncbi:hypothetical protein V8G54_005781 [Vigna mungo]|uniref:inositol-phosphate phosphatase n=1 Tax=Vigna mungo TaxID=3915 RepID=A0AAQ3S402_VIGMU